MQMIRTGIEEGIKAVDVEKRDAAATGARRRIPERKGG
jgi:hypothetical protein